MGQRRVTGENWLVKKLGAYLPLANETVVNIENGYVVTDNKALHLRALKTFTDDFGQTRNNGDEWLLTKQQTETHILNVYEQFIAIVNIITLNSRQYCVILNPLSGNNSICLIIIIIRKYFLLKMMEKINLERKN
jgi:major vault protein